jgi:NAD(P)-dependent dehydrogenase (short-subunit alcohol dehydrogenase family)
MQWYVPETPRRQLGELTNLEKVGFVKSLRDSEPLTGVKVTTICPGIVDTPLITPEKTEQFSVTAETGLSADSVANHMLDLIQSKDHPCGTVLELTLDGARTIPDWNVSPPVSRGSGQELEVDDAKLKAMLQPVQKKLQEERSSSGTSML